MLTVDRHGPLDGSVMRDRSFRSVLLPAAIFANNSDNLSGLDRKGDISQGPDIFTGFTGQNGMLPQRVPGTAPQSLGRAPVRRARSGRARPSNGQCYIFFRDLQH